MIGRKPRDERRTDETNQDDRAGGDRRCTPAPRRRFDPRWRGGAQDDGEQGSGTCQDGHAQPVVEQPRDGAPEQSGQRERQEERQPARAGKYAKPGGEARKHEGIAEPGRGEAGRE